MIVMGGRQKTTLSLLYFASFSVMILFLNLSLSTEAMAKTYYIDAQSGRDSNSGESLSQAFQSISRANNVLQAGDTVQINSGDYVNQSIQPNQSGTTSAKIVYQVVSGARVIVRGGNSHISLADRSHIKIVGPIEFRETTNMWAYLRNSHSNEIQNCQFFGNGKLSYSGFYLDSNSTNNRIIENTFRDWGSTDGQWGDALRLFDRSNNNLVYRNRFINAGHSLIHINASFNMVKENYLENNWQKGIDLVWADGTSWAPNNNYIAEYNVIEDNVFGRMFLRSDGKGGYGLQLSGANNLVRNNIFYDAGKAAISVNGFDGANHINGNRIVHNTLLNNGNSTSDYYRGGVLITDWGIVGLDSSDNKIKNNIFRDNGNGQQLLIDLTQASSFYSSGNYANYEIAGNCLGSSDSIDIPRLLGARSISVYDQQYSFSDLNLRAVAQFVDEGSRNFKQTSSSPCVDKGVALARTRTGSFGTRISVSDVKYFSDGLGQLPGDMIIVGSNRPVRILQINRTSNEVMVDQSISWNNGDSIQYVYGGAAPDAGAFEVAAPIHSEPPAEPPPPPEEPPPLTIIYDIRNARVSTLEAQPGQALRIQADFYLSAAAMVNTYYEIRNSSNQVVAHKNYFSQSFASGESKTFVWEYTVPNSEDTYTVFAGIFNSDFSVNYFWKPEIARFQVKAIYAPPPPPASDTGAPIVKITSHKNGDSISRRGSFDISASDNVGVVKIEVFVDGYRICSKISAPYSCPYTIRHRGDIQIMVEGHDAAGNVGRSQIMVRRQ